MIDNKISSLTSETQSRVNALMADSECPADLIIFETRRSEERQANLFGLGRSYVQMMFYFPYNSAYWCYAQPKAKKRTWTTRSKHQCGEACDFAFRKNGNITWDVKQKNWDKLVELGKKYGLKSLAPQEYAHLELDRTLTPYKMPEEFTIPEWAAPACKRAKEKGIITKNFDENITAYRLCVILDNLNLLK